METKQQMIETSRESFYTLSNDERYMIAKKVTTDPQSFALLVHASKIGAWCGWDLKGEQQKDPIRAKVQELSKDGLFYEAVWREISISPKGLELLRYIDEHVCLRHDATRNILDITFGLYGRMLR